MGKCEAGGIPEGRSATLIEKADDSLMRGRTRKRETQHSAMEFVKLKHRLGYNSLGRVQTKWVSCGLVGAVCSVANHADTRILPTECGILGYPRHPICTPFPQDTQYRFFTSYFFADKKLETVNFEIKITFTITILFDLLFDRKDEKRS